MAHITLGKLKCVTPGQPIRLTSNMAEPDRRQYVHALVIQWRGPSSGNTYVQLSPADDRTDLATQLAILTKNDRVYGMGITTEINGIDISAIYVDFDNVDDFVIASAYES